MRILAFSDLHENKDVATAIVKASSEADVVVCAGDFGTKGAGCSAALLLLADLRCPFVLVSGNHDSRVEMGEICDTKPDWYLLHGQSICIENVTFRGIGGEIPARSSESWNETLSESEASELLSADPDQGSDVFVTHTPPLGYADRQSDGSHEGSQAILFALYHDKPKLCLCGHIHNSWNTRVNLNNTLVHNLGPTLNWHSL